jgi:hypothetical protein
MRKPVAHANRCLIEPAMNETVPVERRYEAEYLSKSRDMTMNLDGKSVVQSDEQMEGYQFRSVPNYEHTLVGVNPTTPDLREEQRFDRYRKSVVPGPGGTSLHFATFPPSSVFADPSFDGEATRREALIRLRG